MTTTGPAPDPAGQRVPDPGRVDFYVLSAADDAARLRFACRLTEKAYHLQHRVHLHTDSPSDAARLDDLLWTFRQGSFVPHEIMREGQPALSPVTIGTGAVPPPPADLLINLAGDVPPFADGYGRIAEIIAGPEAERARGRHRFRHYKQAGREPVTHSIGSTP